MIASAAQALDGLRLRIESDAGPWIAWLPPQIALFEDDSRVKLLRAGNQSVGKTWAGLKEIDWICQGRHPYRRVRRAPVEAWVICASWSQSVAIQRKFLEVADRRALTPETLARFSPDHGFRHANPVVLYKNGSILRFRTAGQGGLNLSSATIDAVLIDEPTDQRVYTELQSRLSHRGGTMILTLTPANHPVDYLRELSERQAISDLHYRMRPENFIPPGRTLPLHTLDGRRKDEAWIASRRAETLELEADVVLDGEWEARAEGVVFRSFARSVHVRAFSTTEDLDLYLGVDHGSRDFKQRGILVGIGKDPPHTCYVLGEYRGTGATLPDQDADGILDLLRAWGLRWQDLEEARGDQPHDSGAAASLIVGRKSNADLFAAIARKLKVSPEKLAPRLYQAKTGRLGGRGSVLRGLTWLHRAMLRPAGLVIHAGCSALIKDLESWSGADDEHKDAIDALRYALWRVTFDLGAVGTRRAGRLYIP